MRTPLLLLLSLVVVIQYVAGAAEHNGAPFPETEGGLRAGFPKGFLFGTATSAYQVEGMANKEGRGPSIWDTFIKIPGIVANNGTADVTVDQYHRYKEDIDIMVNLNFDAYRFSISWSRIFPNGTGKVNWKGVAYYNRLINYLLKRGITPYANLYHYDLPLALEQKYLGLLSDKVVKDYADYAEFCFKTFGDRVKNWMTFNEPRVVAALGYDNGMNAPGRCSKAYGNCTAGNSATEPYIAAHHMILSHAAAVQRYRKKYQYVAGAAEHNGAPFPETEGGLRAGFPKGFLFGTATSAYQVEGMANKEGRGPSIWDTFVKIPGIVANNATGDVTVDQYHRYKEDIDLMANLNFDAYRFSISWSRIFPNGAGKVNWKGVAYYNRLINYLLERGITPYANLYHYDLPLALEQKYLGLLSDKIVKDYADYAEFCFKTFGDRVKNWMTFNEPRVVAALGYDNGFFAPGRCSKAYGNCTAGNSATEPYIAAHHLILSHAAAVQRYREKYQKTQQGRIGILLDFVWYEPLTRSKADSYAAQRARDFHVGWFLHPIVYGEYPRTIQKIVGNRLPKFTKEEVKMVKGSMDFVGINEYTAYYMYDPHQNQTKPNALGYQNDWNAGFAFEKNGVPIGPRAYSSWLYEVPWGMYKAIMYIKEHYGNPTVILSENGMDNPGNQTLPKGLHDTNRINYYRSYLAQLKKAVDEGANVVGYFAWSLLDNFEWRLGYTSRFGIVYVDFTTLKRYPKMSAYWFKKLLTKKKH